MQEVPRDSVLRRFKLDGESQSERCIMSKVGEGIIRGLKQALAIAQGTAEKGSYVVHKPEEIEARCAGKRKKAFASENKPRLE